MSAHAANSAAKIGQAYRREEVLEGLGVDEGEVHAAEHPGEGVSDGGFEAVPGAADFFLLTSVRQDNAVLCHLTLLYGQPFGVLGVIRKEEECGNSDKDRDAAFDDEEPLPARFVNTMSIQRMEARGFITCRDQPCRPCDGEYPLQGSPR
jgi:hypothetical protein